MRVENAVSPDFWQHEPCSTSLSPLPLQSTLQGRETGVVKQQRPLISLLEDVLGFVRNLLLFPFLGHQILMYQILFCLLVPILLPYILFASCVKALLDLCTCGCLEKDLTPKFDLTLPTKEERQVLKTLVQSYGTDPSLEDHQIRLTHIMSRYVDYVSKYTTNEDYGSKNGRFQSLIKVAIDGQETLFQFCPQDDKKEILRDYLQFLGRHLQAKSHVTHYFIGLDYLYVIGLLKMEMKTDVVVYDSEKELHEEMGICGNLFSFFAPKIGKHYKKDPETLAHFAFWPKFTRDAICKKINELLMGHDLSSAQISLLELDRLIR